MLLPLECFDKIGKFEALNADLEFVLQKIYPQKAIAMKIGGDRVTDANSKLTIYYDEECIAIVKNRFERDFENFHYSNDFKDAIRNEVQ